MTDTESLLRTHIAFHGRVTVSFSFLEGFCSITREDTHGFLWEEPIRKRSIVTVQSLYHHRHRIFSSLLGGFGCTHFVSHPRAFSWRAWALDGGESVSVGLRKSRLCCLSLPFALDISFYYIHI